MNNTRECTQAIRGGENSKIYGRNNERVTWNWVEMQLEDVVEKEEKEVMRKWRRNERHDALCWKSAQQHSKQSL